MKRSLSLLGLLFCGLFTMVLPISAQDPKPAENLPVTAEQAAMDERFAAADKLFDDKNWAEARDAYDKLRQSETNWKSVATRRAVDGAVASLVNLELWDDALGRAKELIEQTKDSFEEARARRFLGGLYLTFPHFGTKQGGKFLRGKYGQGVYLTSFKKDKKEAVANYERARDLLTGMLAKSDLGEDRQKEVTQELIGLDFDLVTALAHQDEQYGYQPWGFCGWWWPVAWEDEEESEALEEADYEEPRYRHWRGYGMEEEEKPTGLPTGPDGQPQFMAMPDQYAATLGQGPKIRYLLEEIQRLDPSENKDDAARALLRWGEIATMLYGPELLNTLNQQNVKYDRWGSPLPKEDDPELPKTKIWELGDDQALTLAGGRIRVVDLPTAESPVAIWRSLESRYPNSSSRKEARQSLARYFQARQQFGKAIAEYEAVIAQFPKDNHSGEKGQIQAIREGDVLLSESGVHLPGGKPRLDYEHRNLDSVEFTAIRFDMARMVQDELEKSDENGYWNLGNYQYRLFQDGKERWKKYTGATEAKWSESPLREADHRQGKAHTLAPLSKPGAYLVEATGAGVSTVSRVLVLVTDLAIVQKNLTQRGLIYLCDAATGQPLANKAVRIYEHWTTYPPQGGNAEPHFMKNTLQTNADGVIEYKRKRKDGGSQVEAVVLGEDDRMAFTFFQNWYEHTPDAGWENGERIYVVTDRPVYRPGETVKYRAWLRTVRNRVYAEPVTGRNLSVQLYDARNNSAGTQNIISDDLGGISGEFTLGDEPPLGIYHLAITGYQPDARQMAGGVFRVEEYKKPEFEVTVKPSSTQAHLGDKFKAVINARYYFGQPVASGSISYKVFRRTTGTCTSSPAITTGSMAWATGATAMPTTGSPGGAVGAGCSGMPTHHGPMSRPVGTSPGLLRGPQPDERSPRDDDDAQGPARARRPRYGHAEARWHLRVGDRFAPAARDLPNSDHRYTIEAEVRDASRRTITGAGSVVATRQAFYAFVETNHGWYRDSGDVQVKVRTLSPDNVPVTANGEVVVYRITYTNGEAAPREEVVKRWEAATDAEGRLAFSYSLPGGGQYRVNFTCKDAWGGEVQGNAIVWARGPEFDGREYRFNNLEVITDKRSYQVGEVAHLLINCAETGSRVLYSDNVSQGVLLSYRFIDVPGRSVVVDVPIEERHVPNFFVEATLVRQGQIHSELRELFVPPIKNLLDLKVTMDKAQYQAGEKGRVRVEARDHQGKPATGEIALTVFDEAVTYIQDEFGPSPRTFFHGQKRYHYHQTDSSLTERFRPTGVFRRPDLEVIYQLSSSYRRGWGLELSGLELGSAKMLGSDRRRGDGVRFKSKSMAKFAEREGRSAIASGMAAPASAPMEMALADSGSGGSFGAKEEAKRDNDAGGGGAPEMVQPEIRTNFADTAFWGPTLKLNSDGVAEAELTFRNP